MGRLEFGRIKVDVQNCQYRITIPRAMALRWKLEKGEVVELETNHQGILIRINR